MEKIYNLEQISRKALCSDSKIKEIIKNMQVTACFKDSNGAHYFTEEQTKMIIENDPRNYEVVNYQTFESKMN